jgi:hypothetical protein
METFKTRREKWKIIKRRTVLQVRAGSSQKIVVAVIYLVDSQVPVLMARNNPVHMEIAKPRKLMRHVETMIKTWQTNLMSISFINAMKRSCRRRTKLNVMASLKNLFLQNCTVQNPHTIGENLIPSPAGSLLCCRSLAPDRF